jgi:pantoate--beta-alanine ligase
MSHLPGTGPATLELRVSFRDYSFPLRHSPRSNVTITSPPRSHLAPILLATGLARSHFPRMRIVRTVSEMQKAAAGWKRQGLSVAFVPTMGYLHAGHISLMERARKLAGKGGRVVVSIYVNPTQFGPREDFGRYPRDFKRDAALCRGSGVDAIFAPDNREMYPAEAYSTHVVEEQLSKGMEGASRPTHFRGVTTVVAKLFNIVQPDYAVFGAKDFQQAAVIQRMVTNLNFPLKIVVAPTFREADGLAMSSRNKYLVGDLRMQATALWRAIQLAQDMVASNKRSVSAAKLKTQLTKLIQSAPSARVDYIEFFEPTTLVPVREVRKRTQIALAVFVGKTRLIDNASL